MTSQKKHSADAHRPMEVTASGSTECTRSGCSTIRLNYFCLETGLLTIYGIMYNKEPAAGFFVPICIVGLAFTLLWLVIQLRHWAYCIHVNTRIKRLVPEYKAHTRDVPRAARRASPSRSRSRCRLPVLFACTWVPFCV